MGSNATSVDPAGGLEALEGTSLVDECRGSLGRGKSEESTDLRSIDPHSGLRERFDHLATCCEQSLESADAGIVGSSFDARDGRLCNPRPRTELALGEPGPPPGGAKGARGVHRIMIAYSLSILVRTGVRTNASARGDRPVGRDPHDLPESA